MLRYRSRLLNHLQHDSYSPRRIEDLARDLGIDEVDDFRAALREMQDDGTIEISNSGVVTLPSVGAQGDLRRVASHPHFVLLGLIVIAVHAAVTLLAVRLLRAPVFFFGAASQACLGGYSSAPVVAAIYEPAMAPLGLLLAVLGNLAGTYLGLFTAEVLAP